MKFYIGFSEEEATSERIQLRENGLEKTFPTHAVGNENHDIGIEDSFSAVHDSKQKCGVLKT